MGLDFPGWPHHVDPAYAALAVDTYLDTRPIGSPRTVITTGIQTQQTCDYPADYLAGEPPESAHS